ncbi:orotate phosphoribosyltransferase domain protein [Acinetobacter baumannii 25493_4]|nr:orotate phosphoribosyltransferase domain protein [Acinetobacter baumannii 25493_4]
MVSCENLTSIVNLEHLMTTPVSFHPQAFIELALSRGVLKFG